MKFKIQLSILNLINISKPIMELNQHKKSQDNQQYKQRIMPFDTQISQQPHTHDKDLAPWVRQKTRAHHQYSAQQINYHKFLANVRLSPKQKNRLKKTNNNQQQCLDLEMIKADLTNKINAEKIANNQYFEQKGIIRANQCRTFLQRRTHLSKLYKRPKSIQLSLEFCEPISLINCKPLSSTANTRNATPLIIEKKKKENSFILTLKKKKENSANQSKFSDTHTYFKPSILDTQKKMYRTLQLNINTFYNKSSSLENQRQPNHFKSIPLATKQRQRKIDKIEMQNQEQMLTCQGISAAAIINQTCRQKIRNKVEFSNKNQKQPFFDL